MDEHDPQRIRDDEHLKLLAIFHYVFAGLAALAGLFPLLHVALGLALASGTFKDQTTGEAPPEEIGWVIAGFAGALVVMGLSFAALTAFAARSMQQRRRHTFVQVVSGVMCLFMPIGTVLGVFTIVVLSRESVRQQFLAEQRG